MSTALVSTANPGDGILVDAATLGRPIGDTSSGSVFLTDLPKNFHGGDEALHFALGELFGQFGKIKKIELYMVDGILETQDFKGEALVVFHKTKLTGSHEKGDPVYDACLDMDGKWRMLGKRGWRMRVEPAQWQKDGFDAKTRAKLHPCVEISNLWDYDGSMSLAWFANMQEEIRKHCSEHVQAPFVKVEPSAGLANVWCKGASDAMKLAGVMHKSFFMGRKIVASLCRKEKPFGADLPKVKIGELSMELPTEVWDGVGPLPEGLQGPAMGPSLPGAEDPDSISGPAPRPESEGPKIVGPQLPASMRPEAPGALRKGTRAKLFGLENKQENNGRVVQVYEYLEDMGKYQVVMMDDGKAVKVKPENLVRLSDEEMLALGGPKTKKKKGGKIVDEQVEVEDAEAAEDEASTALDMASKMAAGEVRAAPALLHDPRTDGFLPTVCVDPALLPKREEPVPEVTDEQKRERSRSRERRQQERMEAVRKRVEASKADRPKWVMASPEEMAAQAAKAVGGGPQRKEPDESREELLKLSVGRLKELLKEYGKSAKGCIEKKDFVDKLKPVAKA